MATLTTMNNNYFADMQIVDERLTKLEEDYDKIIQLLEELTNDLKQIKEDTNE